ncbi:unnamed protein product [Hydatigera taeniaeformis]|uniref:Derlin n=1 Tax=Hydatigena taeniaeformis TaxID=6205 RepID=A0A0R3WZN6_HYDTA|nr:unnamed protein product [Hydatigera taeniaeformis]
MAGNDLADAYYSIPRITRYWLTATIVLSLIGRFGLISAYSLILIWNKFFYELQLLSFLLNIYLLFEPMVLSVIYVWSQLNRDTIVQFWFGTSFKAIYFPWVLVVFNLIIRGSATMELMGIFVGNVYYFFSHHYPLEYGGVQLLKTPEFLYRLFPVDRNFGSGFGVPPPRMRGSDDTSSRGFPGRGRTLNE